MEKEDKTELFRASKTFLQQIENILATENKVENCIYKQVEGLFRREYFRWIHY